MSPPAPPPVQLLLGEPVSRLLRVEAQRVEQALGGSPNAFNFNVLHAGDPEVAGRLFDLLRTVPMMSRCRVVALRELDRAPSALLEALLDYVERPAAGAVLVLSGVRLPEAREGKDPGRRLSNRLQKVDALTRFASAEEDPVAWCQELAAEQGARLEEGAARLLVGMVGTQLGLLEMELAKAITWAGPGQPVTEQAVAAVASLVAEADIWSLTRALVRRDADQALATLHRLLEDGEASHRILAMITWQIRTLLLLQESIRREVSPRSLGVRMPPAEERAALASLRSRALPEAATLDRLARANRQFNRARAGDRRVLERLVMELCAR